MADAGSRDDLPAQEQKVAYKSYQSVDKRRQERGEPPRGPAAEHVAHHQAKIAASHMQQDALEDVLVSAQVGSPHLLQW